MIEEEPRMNVIRHSWVGIWLDHSWHGKVPTDGYAREAFNVGCFIWAEAETPTPLWRRGFLGHDRQDQVHRLWERDRPGRLVGIALYASR